MTMNHAFDVLSFDQVLRYLTLDRSFDLAVIIAQLRWYELHIQVTIDVGFTFHL